MILSQVGRTIQDHDSTPIATMDGLGFLKWYSCPFAEAMDEDDGVLIFNPKNQSFVLIDLLDVACSGSVSFSQPRTGQVLEACGLVRPLRDPVPPSQEPSLARVLPAGVLFPRLGDGLTDSNYVYYLRADTGERYFF